MRRLTLTSLVLLLAVCGPGEFSPTPSPVERTAFERIYDVAEQGDPDAQNLVGFMLFFGEGVPRNRPMEERWFRVAADQGHPVAKVNLAMMLDRGLGTRRDPGAAESLFLEFKQGPSPADLSWILTAATPLEANRLVCRDPEGDQEEGAQVFETFCAGCHGASGLALYRGAPSFALGERMEKTRGELIASVVMGHERMPSWDEKLPRPWLEEALDFVTTLEVELRLGLLHRLRSRPEVAFDFGAMSGDRQGPVLPERFEASEDLPPVEPFCPAGWTSADGGAGAEDGG
jgi:mono/diheme cytochrome c family protein